MPLARRLLSTAVFAVLVHGCLIPQDDPVLPDLPRKRNTPPKLLPGTAVPQQRDFVIDLGPGCNPPVFSIGVMDPDLGVPAVAGRSEVETIGHRWFVDHDQKFTTDFEEGGELPSDGGPTSERGTLTIPGALFQPKQELFKQGNHYITVVVADRDFIAYTEPNSVRIDLRLLKPSPLPDGGTTPDTSSIDTYTWEVATDRTTACLP